MANECEIDLSNCKGGEELDCLVQAIASCECPVFPTWEQFQVTLDNPTIITNLETDGTYVTVKALTRATSGDLLAVAGIGPVSVTAIEAALAVYNLELTP